MFSSRPVTLQRRFLAGNYFANYFCKRNFKEMKRIAIPISNNQLSEYFGQCHYYEIFEIEEGKVQNKSKQIPSVSNIMELPEWLKEQGVTDVIAFKVDRQIITLFASKKVNLFVGVRQNATDILIQDYLKGNLKSDIKIIKELIN